MTAEHPIAAAVRAAFAGHTAATARFIGLYTGRGRTWSGMIALYLRDALTTESAPVAYIPVADIEPAVEIALAAIRRERRRLNARPKTRAAA